MKKKRPVWLKWGIVAACLLLVIVGALMLPSIRDGKWVIKRFQVKTSGCYATPSPGDIEFTTNVREAHEKYKGKKVAFLLKFDMFKENDGELETLSEDEETKEYKRLISLGYELYTAECWTYQGKGQKKYYTTVVGYFTESDLALFNNNPEYGYFFDFVTNGDGSSISVDKKDIITDLR